MIYVPDQDELAHRCESPEEEVGSPVESGDEGEVQQEVEQGEELPQVFMEEISDTHIAILSKYISEDQVSGVQTYLSKQVHNFLFR